MSCAGMKGQSGPPLVRRSFTRAKTTTSNRSNGMRETERVASLEKEKFRSHWYPIAIPRHTTLTKEWSRIE